MKVSTCLITGAALLLIFAVNAFSANSVIDILRSEDPDKYIKACKKLKLDECIGERKGGGFEGAHFLQLYDKDSIATRYLLVFSWASPYDGQAVLLDGGGHVLDKKRVGFVKSLSDVVTGDSGRRVVVIDAIEGTGTGTRMDKYRIFDIVDDKFVLIWSEASFEKELPLGFAPDDNFVITGSISFYDTNGDGTLELFYNTKRINYKIDSKTEKIIDGEVTVKEIIYKYIDGRYVAE